MHALCNKSKVVHCFPLLSHIASGWWGRSGEHPVYSLWCWKPEMSLWQPHLQAEFGGSHKSMGQQSLCVLQWGLVMHHRQGSRFGHDSKRETSKAIMPSIAEVFKNALLCSCQQVDLLPWGDDGWEPSWIIQSALEEHSITARNDIWTCELRCLRRLAYRSTS